MTIFPLEKILLLSNSFTNTIKTLDLINHGQTQNGSCLEAAGNADNGFRYLGYPMKLAYLRKAMRNNSWRSPQGEDVETQRKPIWDRFETPVERPVRWTHKRLSSALVTLWRLWPENQTERKLDKPAAACAFMIGCLGFINYSQADGLPITEAGLKLDQLVDTGAVGSWYNLVH